MGQLLAELLGQSLPQQMLQRRTTATWLRRAPVAPQMPKLMSQKCSLILQRKEQSHWLRYAHMECRSCLESRLL